MWYLTPCPGTLPPPTLPNELEPTLPDRIAATLPDRIAVEETLAWLNSLTSETQPASAANITFSAMAEVKTRCSETQAARMSASLHVVDQQVAGVSMWCDISTSKAWPLAPACHRRQVFPALQGVLQPRHQGLPLPHISPVLVEGDEDRHRQLVQRLPGVSDEQDHKAVSSGSTTHPSTQSPF